MSQEQLKLLLSRLEQDQALRQQLKSAANLEAAQVIAKEAGFDVSKEDWLSYRTPQGDELSDQQLESVAGGLSKGEGCTEYCSNMPGIC